MNTKRDRSDGRYTFTKDAMCACGHSLGIHTAEAPHECGAHEAHLIDPTVPEMPPCSCVKFRKIRNAG
jgi:hypothetical protein